MIITSPDTIYALPVFKWSLLCLSVYKPICPRYNGATQTKLYCVGDSRWQFPCKEPLPLPLVHHVETIMMECKWGLSWYISGKLKTIDSWDLILLSHNKSNSDLSQGSKYQNSLKLTRFFGFLVNQYMSALYASNLHVLACVALLYCVMLLCLARGWKKYFLRKYSKGQEWWFCDPYSSVKAKEEKTVVIEFLTNGYFKMLFICLSARQVVPPNIPCFTQFLFSRCGRNLIRALLPIW